MDFTHRDPPEVVHARIRWRMFWYAFRFISDAKAIRNATGYSIPNDIMIDIDMALGRYVPEHASIVEASEVAAFEHLSDLIGNWLLMPHPDEPYFDDVEKIVNSDFGRQTHEAACRCIWAMMRNGMSVYPEQDASPFGEAVWSIPYEVFRTMQIDTPPDPTP